MWVANLGDGGGHPDPVAAEAPHACTGPSRASPWLGSGVAARQPLRLACRPVASSALIRAVSVTLAGQGRFLLLRSSEAELGSRRRTPACAGVGRRAPLRVASAPSRNDEGDVVEA